jgi:hypothetical protein
LAGRRASSSSSRLPKDRAFLNLDLRSGEWKKNFSAINMHEKMGGLEMKVGDEGWR